MPKETVGTSEKIIVNIKPFYEKQSVSNVNWDLASELDIEGFQVASSELFDQCAKKQIKENEVNTLFMAEISCTDGTLFQVPLVKNMEDMVKTEKATTKLVSRQKVPSGKAKIASKSLINIRPFEGQASETKITWDKVNEFDLEGYKTATSEFVKNYSPSEVDQGKLDKLYVAEINWIDGSVFQVPILKDKELDPRREVAITKLVSKQKLPTNKVKNVEKAIVNIRPFKGTESDSHITWDVASEIELEGYQVVNADFVKTYSDDEVENTSDQLFMAEIKYSDGSKFKVPVIKENTDIITETATMLPSYQQSL
jgi:hypothetical protein